MTPTRTRVLIGRILAGTDGSTAAEEAARQAARLASLTGASLEVAFAYDTTRPPSPSLGGGEDPGARAGHALEEAARLAGKEGVEADPRLLAGDPAHALVREARDRWANLICVGPDAGFLEKPRLLGGVALHVLRQAHGSVLVARPPGAPGAGEFPRRVLCAVDGSPHSFEAVRQSAALAALAGAELRLLHVVPVFRGHNVGWTVEGDQQGFEPLDPAVEIAREQGVEPAREMAMGRPGPAIAEVARREGFDLIAVGSRGLSGLSRVLLGSVGEWVARHADCSVLVARPSARE